MTTGRRPAGAPDPGAPDTEDRAPAGSPLQEEAELGSDDLGGVVSSDIDELLETRKERDEYLQLAQRTQADFENYRRRVARESQEAERRGTAKLAAELIGVLDNLERALRTAGVDPDGPEPQTGDGNADEGGLLHGVLLTYRDLTSTLTRAGVEPFDPLGERFDPNWHEAVTTRPEEGVESGLVVEVADKGYRLDGLLLRAARVVVSE